jgi:hypothetical protein
MLYSRQNGLLNSNGWASDGKQHTFIISKYTSMAWHYGSLSRNSLFGHEKVGWKMQQTLK